MVVKSIWLRLNSLSFTKHRKLYLNCNTPYNAYIVPNSLRIGCKQSSCMANSRLVKLCVETCDCGFRDVSIYTACDIPRVF